ncbi:sigma-70 family RNA polymerase sigma factor, partial [Planctomycetota bacterium]
LKYGGEHQKIDLDEATFEQDNAPSVDDLIALDEALSKLSVKEKTRAEVAKLRYFAGLSVEQTADILEISPTTVKRYWAYARAWLLREIG